MSVATRVLGAPVDRLEGRDKVQGKARYAYEHEVDRVAYGALVASTVA
jgi:xanthine dehydrogenase YagR molybdenum-binding subunit